MNLTTSEQQALCEIRDAGAKIYAVSTGAGTAIQQALWEAPGASKALVGAAFPYASEETTDFLGYRPPQFVTCTTAIALAMAAYIRAKAVAGYGVKAVGLATTAAVATNRELRGGSRVHGAVVSDFGCRRFEGKLSGSRAEQDETVTRAALNLLYRTMTESESPFVEKGSEVSQIYFCRGVVENLFWGLPAFFRGCRFGKPPAAHPESRLWFPGSFNPPHAGHFDMAQKCSHALTSLEPVYLINARHPSKGDIGNIDLLARAAYLKGHNILFTRDQPLMVDKIKAIGPNANLAMGADTLAAMLDPKWGPSLQDVLGVLYRFNVRVHCFGRAGVDTTDYLRSRLGPILFSQYRQFFCDMGPSLDISSTAIRNEIDSIDSKETA